MEKQPEIGPVKPGFKRVPAKFAQDIPVWVSEWDSEPRQALSDFKPKQTGRAKILIRIA